MVKKHEQLTREDVEKLYREPPLSYSGHTLDQRMKMWDDLQEWKESRPDILPKDMHQANFTGYSDESIDDIIEINCECGKVLTIAGGYITLCQKCGRGYRVISYIAQYEKRKE